jgi:hypothetical protein
MQSYDTVTCARKCTGVSGCQAFNIYYERDLLQNPDNDRCSLASTTQIEVCLPIELQPYNNTDVGSVCSLAVPSVLRTSTMQDSGVVRRVKGKHTTV